MRKWLLALSIAGLVTVSLLGCFLDRKGGMTLSVISPARAEKIEQRLSLHSETMNLKLKFNGEILASDSAGKTFFLPLSMEESEWENGAFETEGGEEVLFTEDFTKQDKLSLIAGNRSIPFYAVSEKGYEKYYLKLTGLPVMTFEGTELFTEGGELLYEMTLYDTEHSGDWVTKSLTTSTLRGNTSLSYEKKSLRLKLKEQKEDGSIKKADKNLLGIRKDDDWILNSLYADNSRIRDKLAMELWQEVGAENNPYGKKFGVTGEYVEVIVNGGYAGLYLLTHPVDRKQLGMDKVSIQLQSGEEVIERIYKKKYSAPWISGYFVGELPDSEQADYRGGFYLKGDTVLGNEEEWKPLYDLAVCMEMEDGDFAERIGEITDISNLVDNWLFFQAIAGFDNENKNIYYISRRKETGSYGYFIPWDMNISFGALYAENEFYCTESMKEVESIVKFQPGTRVVELDAQGAAALAADKWSRWRSGAFSTEQIYAHMDAILEQIVNSGAMEREKTRWPNGNAGEDITFMKEFTKKRLEFVDAYIEELTE